MKLSNINVLGPEIIGIGQIVKLLAKNCKGKKFNILLYMDRESHSLENTRLIRLLTSTPKHQNSLNAFAAVFKNSPNPGIRGNEGHFSTTEDAVDFIKQKNEELKNKSD